MDKKIVLILNGPPGCGKDTLGTKLAEIDGVETFQFKDALYLHTLQYFNVSAKFSNYFTDRQLKEKPTYLFEGMSPRKALQYVSEEVIKPKYGKRYFGEASLEAVKKSKANICIFTDGGFVEELEVFSEDSDVVLYVVQLHRAGFSFKGDTRDYVSIGAPYIVILEDGMVDEAVGHLVNVINEVLEENK